MDQRRVSIIIPTQNRQTVVAGAVRSALAQEGALLEVCVVDDGSEPPLRLPSDLAAEERVTLIRLDVPRGPGAARNAGLATTTADLVAFLDDDDVWLPGKLERQLRALSGAGADTVMVACGFELWDGARLVAAVVPSPAMDAHDLLAHPCLWPSTVVVRRAAIETAGGFDETLPRTQDWDLWLRLADLGTIAVVPEVLVDRRWATLAPETAFAARAAMDRRIEERLAQLPARDAARLRSRRHCDDGVVLARLGRRGEAAKLLLRAWRDSPASRLPPRALARVALGERLWARAARIAAPARGWVRRRPPRPAGPAPVWGDP
jgi:glycosyltransferase involved in cell wall biosynthesis